MHQRYRRQTDRQKTDRRQTELRQQRLERNVSHVRVKTGSTQRIATLPEEDRATVTGDLHKKIREDWSSGSRDMLAESQTEKTDHNTLLPLYRGRMNIHCVSKNDIDVAHYNFNAYQLILVIFGRVVAERI